MQQFYVQNNVMTGPLKDSFERLRTALKVLRSRTPYDVRQPDRVRVHLDDRPDRGHSPLHEGAPRHVVTLSARSDRSYRAGSFTPVLAALGTLAAWLPARRASQVDPMRVLRGRERSVGRGLVHRRSVPERLSEICIQISGSEPGCNLNALDATAVAVRSCVWCAVTPRS